MNEAPKRWVIEYRGRLTDEVGTDHELANTSEDARLIFEGCYPMREVIAVSEEQS